jgi:hypothetical protein
MTWKTRRRKKFLRHIKSLEETDIFSVDKYIVINEYAGGDPYKNYEWKQTIKATYEEDLKSGRIRSSFDFDNYFNPDLNLLITFEKDEKKANSIIEKALHQIGKRWEERLKKIFPENKYTLVMYFDSENSEWFLDFYNGVQQITDSKNPDRFKGIFYFST